ncbi:MAG: alpha/beta fold hydrolase [Geodermatophilaceae bacterium]|nr:alpha/beta fold hydrolase [Geodermatophilaceae bacterium]
MTSPRTPRRHRSRARRLGALGAASAVLAGLVTWAPTPASAAGAFTTEVMTITSGTGADAVDLDTTVFTPDDASAGNPAAAIVIAHGYGGTKEEGKGQATKFARDGYVVVTYSARGFGESTGEISMDAPDYEVADARTLIDMLAERDDVVQDGDGDPRVGFFGGSYGGGLALLTAAYDQRVDAVSAARTWNSLVNALFPNNVGAPTGDTPAASGDVETEDGVFKKLWAQFFFEGGQIDAEGGGGGEAPARPSTTDGCGGLRPEYCAAYEAVLQDNALTEDMRSLLEASSPASVIDQVMAPTLLIQGEGDKLFPLSEADANARGIAANGTPVKVVWVSGGHGAARTTRPEAVMLDQIGTAWFDFYLRDQGSEPDRSFTYTEVTGQGENGQIQGEAKTVDAYPGLAQNAAARIDIPLAGNEQSIDYPQGGDPAAFSAVPPGFVAKGGSRRSTPEEIDGQYALFDSGAISMPLALVGSPTLSVRVASTTGEAVLFGKIYDVAPDGEETLVQSLVSPLMLTGLPATLAEAQPTTLSLPPIAKSFDTGHLIRVVLASTDQGYAGPAAAATYQVALAEGAANLSVPDVTGEPAPDIAAPTAPEQPSGGGIGEAGGNRLLLIAGGLAVLIVVVALVVMLGRRNRGGVPR